MATPTVTRGGVRSARFLAVGTTARIVLTPIVMWLVLTDDSDEGTAAATVLFCIAAATDWVDGRLARRWGVTSKLGSFLDTTADKLLVSGVLIALVSRRPRLALARGDHHRPRAGADGAARGDRRRGHA